jgi:hypothetical protein
MCAGTASADGAGPVETPETYEITVDLAVSTLPKELRPFFETCAETLRAGATAAVSDASAPPGDVNGTASHFVLLDVAADEDDWEARRRAADRFPRDRARAERLFTKAEAATGGTLPWKLESDYHVLVAAFTAGDARQLADSAAALLHFATDAALPFNTTTSGHPAVAQTGDEGARHRFHVLLAGNLSERFRHEARVWPGRCAPRADVTGLIFETLLHAHCDAGLLAGMSHDRPSAQRGPSIDIELLAARAAPILEGRIEAGALLGANLIVSAWVEAGRPALPQTEAAQPADSDVDGRLIEKHAFVGSRNSTIVHRVTCAHARRVKPVNRVYFDSAAAARSAGRTDCKACDPYGAPD